MSKKLLSVVAVALIAGAPLAIAQTAAPATPAPMATTADKADAGMMQKETDHRASKLIGTTVYNQANENIGEINDLVISGDKSVTAILGVGGFLGMGERNVAVPMTSLKLTRDGTSWKVVVDGTKESLAAMPAYVYYKS